MNNAHPVFTSILDSICPTPGDMQLFKRAQQLMEENHTIPREAAVKLAKKQISKYPIMFRLADKWEQLHESRKTAAPEYQYPIIMNMARIKTILRERYNYTVAY